MGHNLLSHLLHKIMVSETPEDHYTVVIKEKCVITGRYWTKQEMRQWTFGLFCGTAMLYAARTIMPMCIVVISTEMNWDRTEAGTVLSAFFWGYTMTQFLGGFMSDRLGSDVVLPIAACLWSLITFWTPQLSYLSTDQQHTLYLVVLSRIVLGIFQGFHYPGITSIISRKVPEAERSLTYSIVSSGSHCGLAMFGAVCLDLMSVHFGVPTTLLTGSIGSLLMEHYGWQVPFYVIGTCGMAWMLCMRYLLVERPQRSYIHLGAEDRGMASRYPVDNSTVPWLSLLAMPAFWSLLIGHFCENNAFYILLSWLPTFFHENYPSAKTVALCGTSLFLVLLTHTDTYYSALFCMALAVACCGFHNSGILVNPQDIAPKHAGSVFGIMNMAGSIPGFIGVYVAGHLLESTKSWSAVFNQTAAVCMFGWIVFVLFGTGKRLV